MNSFFRKIGFCVLFTCCVTMWVNAQTFDFSKNCEKAYLHIISLNIDSGNYYLQQEITANPDNDIPLLLENYIDFLEIYTSNSSAIYEERKQDFESRIKTLKSSDKSSPYFLFCQAEIHLQAAVLHIKFGEYVAAIFDVKKSFKKLEESQNQFPDFLPTKKSLGTLYTILGSVPSQYQSGLEFFGMKGSVKDGMNMLANLLDEEFVFQHETATIYAFLQLHIANNPSIAWQVTQEYDFSAKSSLMDAYALGHIGIHGAQNDAGITALLQKPTSSEFLDFPYLNFLLGLGKTYRQDSDANTYFQTFLNQNVGEDYVKSAYHKMAWNELIAGNTPKYDDYLAKISDNGRAVLDTDKQAERELTLLNAPNPVLLKARLLTDGNYLTVAQELLESLNINDFKERAAKTEYFYRLGRVYDKKNLSTEAKKYYELTVANGKNVKHYYAANSAYLLGYIYEKEFNIENAATYYEMAVSLEGYEYENSIRQKAKAGLNRIE